MPTSRTQLSRSCKSCIKAKRRCSLESPSCRRCSTHNLRCSYINELSTATSVPSMQSNPQLLWLLSNDNRSSLCTGFVNGRIRTGSCRGRHLEHHRNDDRTQDFPEIGSALDHWRHSGFAFANTMPSTKGFGPRLVQPSRFPVELTLDDRSIHYILYTLQPARSQRSPLYIHKRLKVSLPRPYTAAKVFGLVEEASQESDSQTRERVTNNLERSTQELIAYTHRTKPGIATLLYCVQALLEAEITLAFSDSLMHAMNTGFLSRRARQFKVLSQWCWRLWKQAPWVLPNRTGTAYSWLFAESLRRTLLVAHLACDVFSVLSTGVFRFTGFVSTLPYDSRTWLWNEPDGHGEHLNLSYACGATAELQSFRELIVKFEKSQARGWHFDDFESLLLVACRGYEATRARLSLRESNSCQAFLDFGTRSAKPLESQTVGMSSDLDFGPFQ